MPDPSPHGPARTPNQPLATIADPLERAAERSRRPERARDAAALERAALARYREKCRWCVDNHEEWLIRIADQFERAIVEDDSVNSEVSMTNGTFPRTFVELLPWWEDFDTFNGNDLRYDFESTVEVDQDEDRPYWGHEVEVSAILTVERFGRRLFGRRGVEVTRARLRWKGEPTTMVE